MPTPRLCRGCPGSGLSPVTVLGLCGFEPWVVLGIVSGLRAASPGARAPVREARAMAGTRRKAGLLGPQVEGYRAWLEQRGYTPGTVRNMLKDLGQVGRVVVGSRALKSSQLNEDRVCGVSDRPAGGRPPARPGTPRDGAAAELSAGDGRRRRRRQPLDHPAGCSARAVPVLDGPGTGLAAATVLRYENTARRFLSEQASP